MGANSRRRREARRRRDTTRQRPGGSARGPDDASRFRASESATARRTAQYLDHATSEVQRSLRRSTAARNADFLLTVLPGDAPVAALLASRLRRAHRWAVSSGWTASELEQVIVRRVGP